MNKSTTTPKAALQQAHSARIVLCGRKEDPFARVSKTMLTDNRLSFKAKGILAYLLGKPPHWKVRVTDLANQSTEGPASIRAGLMELRQHGYCELTCLRDGGKVKEWVWKVSDAPIFSPELDNQDVENNHHSKNEPIKNDCLKSLKGQQIEDLPTPLSFSVRRPSKEEQLRVLKWKRKTIPGEEHFWDWCEDNEWVFGEYRPDLYDLLVTQKFHHWNAKRERWVPIRDLHAYLEALNERIAPCR
jgi:hypothetical protein